MKMSVSMSYIWQLAGREAIAAEHKEILPEHFFLALLKLSEISSDEIEKVAAGQPAVDALKEDVKAIRGELQKRHIGPAVLRRAIRSALGGGGAAYEGGEMHRSSASREYFDKAAMFAADARSDVLAGESLLAALLESPTSIITSAMGDAIARDPKKRAAVMPLLAKHGRDITAEAANEVTNTRMPEARAVIRTLQEGKRRCVLLASDAPATAQAVVAATAALLAGEDAPAALKGCRFVDVSQSRVVGAAGQADRDLLTGLLSEAATAKNIILFVPPLESTGAGGNALDWEGALRSIGLSAPVPLICRLGSSLHERICKDPVWRAASHIITLQDEATDSIPDEL